MAGMVNDLLEVTRMNAGVVQWTWGNLQLMAVCDRAVDPVRALVDHARVKLTVEATPPDLAMRGDAAAIERLVRNLVENACNHTTDGFIRVQARRTVTGEGRFVELSVRDSGSGMSRETAARLGVPFALNSGAMGESYIEGSGLGFSICRGIVAAHGGTISVKTSREQGTTVAVTLRDDLSGPQPIGNESNIVCKVLP
jgi:signal transduction histidine kinase